MSKRPKDLRLTTTDYAFLALRGLIILGGIFWLIFHPLPLHHKDTLILLFIPFVLYSLLMVFFAFRNPSRIESVYLAVLILDLILFGVFIKLSGGINSELYVAMYLLVALHSYYYGLSRGLVLAFVCTTIYLFAIYGQWGGDVIWLDLTVRLAILFLISGFLGFLSERARHDKDEIVRTHMELRELEKRLVNAYRNLKDVKKQVAQSEKLASVGKLAAELAHEINNPLDGIKNCLSLFKRNDAEEGLKKKYLALMEEGLQDIEDAVRNLLEYVKKHEFREEPVDINALLNRTFVMIECKLKKQRISLRKSLSENLPFVMGDTHHLQQVFFNILLNAVDAMPDGGTLTVEAEHMNGYVVVKISDTGTGIPKKTIGKIFEPFYTTKTDGKGTGLGLPISLDIVEKHHGTIEVYSFQGMGTTFKINLKALKSAESMAVGNFR